MTPRWQWAVIAYLLLWAFCCTGCRHTYQKHQTATRTEETRAVWQTETTAVEQQQSVATEKKQGSKRTREFDPKTGNLVKDVLEQYQSDGKVQVEVVSASQSTAEGSASRSEAASSSSTTAAATRAGWSWWWALLAVPVALGVWALRGWLRSRIPFL